MTDSELRSLISSGELDRVELTRAAQDTDKFREAICSFSNDIAGRNLPGYLIIGVDEKNPDYRLKVKTEMLERIAALRSDGAIIPLPVMNVTSQPHPDGDGEVILVEVLPHDLPPVRYRGRTHIRIGPRKDTASEAEERVLFERRASQFRTFDATPCPEGNLARLDLELFKNTYRVRAIDPDIIAENNRSIEEQLAALRFYNTLRQCPTNAGMITFAHETLDLFPGSRLQFVQFDGKNLDNDVLAEKSFSGNLISLLAELDAFLGGRFLQRPDPVSPLRENAVFDFPPDAVRELLMNAVVHRDYQSTAPTRFYQFSDRIEIQNPGGLHGDAAPENFPNVNSYRNPILAEVMHTLGYVNRFGRGIARAKRALTENGSEDLKFEFHTSHFLAVIPKRT
ncbi:MAG: ATP-binding protein [Verrucomicrobiota bacterium]